MFRIIILILNILVQKISIYVQYFYYTCTCDFEEIRLDFFMVSMLISGKT